MPVGGRGVAGAGALLKAAPTLATSSGDGGGLGMLSGSTTGVSPAVFDWLMVDVGTPAVLSTFGGSA